MDLPARKEAFFPVPEKNTKQETINKGMFLIRNKFYESRCPPSLKMNLEWFIEKDSRTFIHKALISSIYILSPVVVCLGRPRQSSSQFVSFIHKSVQDLTLLRFSGNC